MQYYLKNSSFNWCRLRFIIIIHKLCLSGILSGDLLAVFRDAKIQIHSALENITLSPSFYFPSNLLSVPCTDYTALSAQFHCVRAWTMLPDFEARCHNYFVQPRSKNEYLLFTKALLKRGRILDAKNLLEKTLQFKWPETYRYFQTPDPDQFYKNLANYVA